jgi:hypothetical protein
MRYRFIAFIPIAFIWATCAFGQNSANFSSGPNGFSGSATFGPPMPFAMRAVTGAPYSADQVNEQVQTLADGTHITRKSASIKEYRDSAGRTRTERPIARGLELAGRIRDSPTIVEITDPGAQVKYTLDTVNKVAHRQLLPAAPVPRAAVPVPGGAVGKGSVAAGVGISGLGVSSGARLSATTLPSTMAQPQVSDEKLETQTIEGVLAEGTRHTMTWPVDSQGNDRPISVVNETWTAVNLKVVVLSRNNDPRSGENTQKLVNISQAEPDASLFQPPPDYSVVDESGAFTIKWGSQE